MAFTIQQALASNKTGYYIGHRIVLPFKCQLLKLIINHEIYTEMVGSKNIKLNQDTHNTSIYIRSIGKFSSMINSYQQIKMICTEMDDDICDIRTHIKLILEIKDSHVIEIHQATDDDLFIE